MRSLILVLALSAQACTIGQTRVMFTASLAADVATTAIGLSRGHSEANPVVSWNPTVGIAVTALAVVAIAELTKRRYPSFARGVYIASSVLHLGAATYNLTVLGKQ